MFTKPTDIFCEHLTFFFYPGGGESSTKEEVVLFPRIVSVSSTGEEDFQSKNLEGLRSARAGVEHLSGSLVLCYAPS